MKDPSHGWLKDYFELKRDYYVSSEYHSAINNLSLNTTDDSYLYQLVAPTGLIYGCPVQMPFNGTFHNQYLSEGTELCLIMADCFYHCNYLVDQKLKTGAHTGIDEVLANIISFYSHIAPNQVKKIISGTGNTVDKYLFIENILAGNIDIRNLFVENNFTRYFFISLLFLDLIFFNRWLDKKKCDIVSEYEPALANLLKIFIYTAFSGSNKLSRGEKHLFQDLVSEIKLSENSEKDTLNFIKTLNPEHIRFELIDSYSLKKLCYETVLYVSLMDNKISGYEENFINLISRKLNLAHKETGSSMESVQKFITDHWDNKVIYDRNINYKNIHNSLYNRLMNLIEKNKPKLQNEISESKELMELLSKSTRKALTQKEKEKVRQQLFDILKTIPSLAIFILPGGSLLFPILLRILPKQLMLPSSFLDKKE